MINYIRSAMIVGMTVLLVPGCDSEESSPYDEPLGDWVDDEGRLSFRDFNDNATIINGMHLNGMRFNGMRFNGMRFNGMRFNGMRFNGSSLNSPFVDSHNKLKVKNESDEELAAEELDGLVADVDVEDPETSEITEYEMSQTEVETLASGLVLQTVKRRIPGGTWENACDSGVKSILLRGEWDLDSAHRTSNASDKSTWACADGALGACALWGYVPGEEYAGEPLDDYHQACLFVKRADYCGVGQHHTENGHSLDVYDNVSLMSPETVGLWGVEAMWGPEGAICMNFTRKFDYTKDVTDTSKEYIGCEVPDCVDVNEDGVIDFVDYPEALIADRTVPKWKVH